MDENPKSILNDINLQHSMACEYVVCLVDVLATEEKFKKWPKTGVNAPATCEPIFDSVRSVRRFRDAFVNYFENLQQGRQKEKLKDSLPEHSISHFQQCVDYRLGAQWFSDTFVFYTPTRNRQGEPTIAPIADFLMACCMAMLESLANCDPVRGALCVGQGIELCKDNFFGPVFAEAHTLESKCAGYPRVVVSHDAVTFLENMRTQNGTDKTTTVMKSYADRLMPLVAKDKDGQTIADYIGPWISNQIPNDATRAVLRARINAAYNFALREEQRFGDEGNEKLTGRYRLLCRYLESRLHLWEIPL